MQNTHGEPEQQPSKGLIRQVFMSHTGQDEAARDFAASVLKPALESAGLQVFIDYRDLQPGEPWPERLIQAACRSAVMVVVLSSTYTKRFWCMLESDLAMHGSPQCPRELGSDPLIIPVFLSEPDSIVQVPAIKQHWADFLFISSQQQQQQQGQQWEQQHQQSGQLSPECQAQVKPERWARNISDMKEQLQHVRLSAVPESAKDRLWQLAMRVVARAVPQVFTPVYVEEGLFGHEEQLFALLSEVLHPKMKTGRLGAWIHGLGGSGKTTLAKLLFNRLAQGFAHRAFISLDPGDGSKEVQQHLVGALAALGASNINQQLTAVQLLAILQDFVRDKAVLLVIDNVWRAEQLDGILPPQLHPGSTLIITSRRRSLHSSKRYKAVDDDKLLHHPAALINYGAAQQLFRLWADPPDPLPECLAQLEVAILEGCAGLPLALEVAGAQLARQSDPGRWQEVLHALKQAATLANADDDSKLKGVLITSFNTLSEAAQNILLDVVSVLHGTDVKNALAIWLRWWPRQAQGALEELQCRALVSISKHTIEGWKCLFTQEERLHVHDIIRSFGRDASCAGHHRDWEHTSARSWPARQLAP